MFHGPFALSDQGEVTSSNGNRADRHLLSLRSIALESRSNHWFRFRTNFIRHNGAMDLESASQELYRIAPAQFTAARDSVASDARQAGQQDLASSLRKLRKPSVGAWLANLLVLEESRDVQSLVDLGAELRVPESKLEGEQIRRVSKAKGDVVARLVQHAMSMASRVGQPVSAAASQELEETLEAAFADPNAAESLLRGRLSSGLHYSGLGFGEPSSTGLATSAKSLALVRGARSKADQVAAEHNLEKARQEAERADAELENASHAVVEATQELTRLKSAESRAIRQSKEAGSKVSSAENALDKLHQS